MNINLDTLKRLLVEHVRVYGRLPCKIEVNPDSELAPILKRVTPSHMESEETPEGAVTQAIEDFRSAIGDEIFESNGGDTLEQMSDAFAQRIQTGFATLKSIQHEVSDIVARMTDAIDKSISTDPFLNAHSGRIGFDAEPDFASVDWSPSTGLSSEMEVVRMINERGGATGVDATSRDALQLAASKLKGRISGNWRTANVTPETYSRMVNEMVEYSGLTADKIRPVAKVLTDAEFANRVYGRILTDMSDTTDVVNTTTDYLDRLNVINSAVTIMTRIELSSSTKNILDHNVALLMEVAKTMAYFVIHSRRVVYADTILLPNRQLNPDLVEDFKEKGGKLITLERYAKYFLDDRGGMATTGRGVRLDAAMNAEKLVRERADKETVNVESRVSQGLIKIRRSTFRNVMVGILKSDNANGEGASLPIEYRRAVELVDQIVEYLDDESPIEDFVYTAMFRIYHPNSFVNVLHRRLGSKFVKTLSTHSDLDDATIQSIETSVVAQLISEFVVSSGIMNPVS